MKKVGWILMVCCWLMGCSDDDDSPLQTEELPRLTVVTALGGLGDMGYNDLILSGIMQFYEQNEIILSLQRPYETDVAQQIITKWADETQDDVPALLVLAGNEYEPVLRSTSIQLKEHQKILLFETAATDFPEGVTTFRINRYGASYLAGCMAREHNSATIIAAMPNDDVLDTSIQGFTDGYQTYSGKLPEEIYLAEDVTGYNMADSAYRVTSEIENSFILPLAGGSNNGVYKYARENEFYLSLIVGMDVDCSDYTTRVPFSIVIKIDELVQKYLEAWLTGETMPQGETYGLSTDYIDIVVNTNFLQEVDIWEDYYDDDEYWSNAYDTYKQEAIEKEVQYEASN